MGKGIIGGLIAAVIGAGVWAAIAYYTGYEIGWIAWGIGALVGFVAAKAAGDAAGDGLGIVAAVIAVLAILGGKYATGYALTQKFVASAPAPVFDDAFFQVMQATEVAEEWQDAGKTLNWPAGMDLETAEAKEHFPADVWKEAMKRWDETPAEERARIETAMEKDYAQYKATIATSVSWDAFKAMFSFWDVLFIGLALVSAFQIASSKN